MIRVLVVDDHPVVRDGLTAILELQDDMEVCGEAADGLEAIRKAEETRPDIVLMDLQLPGVNGAEATRQILSICPETRVLVLTAYDTDDGIMEAVKAGASGYLLKGTPRQDLVQAIRVVSAGGSLLQPALIARLLETVRQPAQVSEPFTDRELDVLNLLVSGLRNKEIGAALGITERTVKFHASLIFQKLGVSSRAEAVATAFKRGLV